MSDEQKEESGEEVKIDEKKEGEKSADGEEEEKGGVGAAIKNVVSTIAQTGTASCFPWMKRYG